MRLKLTKGEFLVVLLVAIVFAACDYKVIHTKDIKKIKDNNELFLPPDQ